MQENPSSIAADSLQSVAFSPTASQQISTHAEQLNRHVSEAGQMLAEGRWEALIEKMQDNMTVLAADFMPNLVSALLVFGVFYTAYRVVGSVLARVLGRSKKVDLGLQSLIEKTFKVASLTLIGVMVLAEFGINVTALLAGLSIAGVAIGFAAKDTLENFISGVTIMLDRPFRVGDYVIIDGTYGEVEEITLRSTRIRTRSHEVMVIPNLQMVNHKLINHSLKEFLRVDIPFGIAYKEYPELARQEVLELVEKDERILDDPGPSVVVTAMSASSVDLQLRVYIQDPAIRDAIAAEYTEKIREALRIADIEIPFPHMQLMIDEARAFDQYFLSEDGVMPALRN